MVKRSNLHSVDLRHGDIIYSSIKWNKNNRVMILINTKTPNLLEEYRNHLMCIFPFHFVFLYVFLTNTNKSWFASRNIIVFQHFWNSGLIKQNWNQSPMVIPQDLQTSMYLWERGTQNQYDHDIFPSLHIYHICHFIILFRCTTLCYPLKGTLM